MIEVDEIGEINKVFRRAFLFFFLGWSPQILAVSNPISYKGEILGTKNLSISTMALRSDGRYLFFSSGDTNIKILDTLDFARVDILETLTNPILDLFLLSDSRLAVVTAKTVQYFDISKIYEKRELAGKFDQVATSTTSPLRACHSAQDNIHILETGSGKSTHLVRTVNGDKQSGEVSWATMFGSSASNLDPLDIYCNKDGFYVVARSLNNEGVESEVWISNGSSATRIISTLSGYHRQDRVLNADSTELLFLYNRTTSQNNSDDSKIYSVSLNNLSNIRSRSIGTEVRSIAGFLVGETSSFGAFVAKDTLYNPSDPASEKLLISSFSNLFSSGDPFGSQSERGSGDSLAGNSTPTFSVSSKSDHYKIIRTRGAGLSLISNAPKVEFDSDPSNQTLNRQTPLNFSFTPEQDVTYEIRIDLDQANESSEVGLNLTKGSLIREGRVNGGASQSVTLTSNDLGLSKNQDYSLCLFSKYDDQTLGASVARAGIRFRYDPPPAAINDLDLQFGDQSVKVSFSLPDGGDLDAVYIFFTNDENHASDFMTYEADINTGIDGYSIHSPVKIEAKSWKGSTILSPLQNERRIYVQVFAMDESGQLSDPSDLKSIIPHRTRTLAEVLGGTESCQLGIKNQGPSSEWLVLMGVFVLLWQLRRMSQKRHFKGL